MICLIARITAILPLAVIHCACSATREVAAGDPYANCADLGDLSLLSQTQADAEQRMRTRVLELGGDTLLFGVRGRTGRLANSPAEISERRSRLLTAATVTDAGQPAIVMTAEQAEEPDALEIAEANAARRRSAAITAETIKPPSGELWFYGAALRCGTPKPRE
jgi:hypothetical protein